VIRRRRRRDLTSPGPGPWGRVRRPRLEEGPCVPSHCGAGPRDARSADAEGLSRLRAGLLALALTGCAAPAAIEREPPAEAQLATRIKIALVEEPTLEAAAIFVEVEDGLVRLSGFTDSDAERERAVALTRGIPGVQGVQSRIQVR